MRLCGSCLQLHRVLHGGFCKSCANSTPRRIAQQRDRRIRQLRRHHRLLMQDLSATEFVIQERKRIANRLKSIDPRIWRRARNRRQLLELAMMDERGELQ
jgi:hypothetical protein